MTINKPLACLTAVALAKAVALGLVVTAAVSWSFFGRPDPAPPRISAPEAVTAETVVQAPLYFEPNVGQAAAGATFLSRGSRYAIALSERGAELTLRPRDRGPRTLHLVMAGGTANAPLATEAALPGKVHYLQGKDASAWHHDVPTFGRIRQAGVYPGIDLVYYGTDGRLEYDFVVSPGVDPDIIRMRFGGADAIDLDPHGDLQIRLGDAVVTQRKPVAFQEFDGERRAVAASYWTLPDGLVGIRLGPYDTRNAIVIDPLINWATYLGGAGDDWAEAVALAPNGELVVLGTTHSQIWPLAPEVILLGPPDVFITRFARDGMHLSTTFMGGENDDAAGDVDIDAHGNIYITGTTTSRSFPTTANAVMRESASLNLSFKAGIPFVDLDLANFDLGAGSDADAFMTKLDPTGRTLLYSTYISGSPEIAFKVSAKITNPTKISVQFQNNPGIDRGRAIAAGENGLVYVGGSTVSVAFPVTDNAFKTELNGFFGSGDGFLVEIDTTKSGTDSYLFGSYFGGSCGESITGVAVDDDGGVVVTGHTETTFLGLCGGFATTPDAAHATFIGGVDAFVAKLVLDEEDEDPGFIYSTFIGTAGTDRSGNVAVDREGRAYATYVTAGSDAEVGSLHLVSLSPDGTAQNWDRDLGLVKRQNTPLSGFTHGLFLDSGALATRLFVVRNHDTPVLHQVVNPSTGASIVVPTGLGPATAATALAADARRLYLVGATTADNLFPEGAQPNLGGGVDAFVSSVIHNPPPVLSAAQVPPQVEGSPFIATPASYTRSSAAPTGLVARVDWGDGSGESEVGVSAGQTGSIQVPHTYRDDGTFAGRVCVSEEGLDELGECLPFSVDVANVPPTVTLTEPVLGPDSPGAVYEGLPNGAVRVRLGIVAAFTDPSELDTHTATIRWLPTQAPEPAPVSPVNRLVIDAEHVFPPGTDLGAETTPIEICVTDKDGGVRCATATLELPRADLSIARFGPAPAGALECRIVDYRVRVTNGGPSVAPNVMIRDELPAGAQMAYVGSLVIGGSQATVTTAQLLDQVSGAFGRAYGQAVAIEGNRAIVTGSATGMRVYERNLQTSQWEHVASRNTFGLADRVALRGDWVLVSNFGDDSAAVQVWHRQAGIWTLIQTLTAPEAGGQGFFGEAIAVSDNTIAVGDSSFSLSKGAVYLYRLNGAVWSFDRKISPGTNSSFGRSVALTHDGERLAVGAPHASSVSGESVSGAVYLYQRESNGTWINDAPAAALAPSDANDNRSQKFGWSVALSGDNATPFLVVGAPYDPGTSSNASDIASGAAYVFQRLEQDSWPQRAKLLPNDPGRDAYFGATVAVSSNRALIGTGIEHLGTEPTQDRAYVFGAGSAGPWQLLARLRPEQVQSGNRFGQSVALSGADILVGAPGAGRAYMFPTCLQPDGPGSLQCNVGSLAPGQSAEFLVSVKLGAGLVQGSATITTTARTFSGAFDPTVPNTASVTTTVSDGPCDPTVDVTPPVIEPTVDGTPGKNGWYVGGPVTVSWSVIDPESAISPSEGCDTITTTTDTNGTTRTCTASSVGGTATRSVTIRLDTKPPTIAASVLPVPDPDTGALSYNVTFPCFDGSRNGASSGVASCPDSVVSYAGGSISRTIEDLAGNTATVMATIPYAQAGPDQRVAALAGCQALVTLSADGSFLPEGGNLLFEWRRNGAVIASGHGATVALPVGVHEIQLVAKVGAVFAVDTLRVHVVDATPPVFTFVPDAIVREATGPRTLVPLPPVLVTDACPVTLTVEAPADEFLAGDTTVLFRATDSSGNAATATTLVTVLPRVDVGIEVDASAPLVAGTTAPFRVAASNAGPSRASGVVVRPTLPPEVTAVPIDSGVESCSLNEEDVVVCTPIFVLAEGVPCLDGPDGLECTVSGLDPGETASFSLTVAAPPSARPAELVAGATALADEPEADASNNTAQVSLLIARLSDVALTAVAVPAPVTAGTPLNYEIQVNNLGPSDASGVVARASVPDGTVVAEKPAVCVVGEGQVTCMLGDLSARASAGPLRVQFMVAPATRGAVGNSVSVASIEPDPDPDNNTDLVTVPIVAETDVSIDVTSAPAPAVAGAPLAYAVVVGNTGPSEATGVVFTLQVPAGSAVAPDDLPLGCVLLTPTIGPGVPQPSRIECSVGRVAAAGDATAGLTFRVDPFARGMIETTARVGGAEDEIDPDESNNVADATTPIVAETDLFVTLAAAAAYAHGAPGTVVAGEALVYTVVFGNTGPSGATEVALAHVLPDGVELSSALPDGCSLADGAVSCGADMMAPGATQTVVIDVAVGPFTRGTLVSTAEVMGGAEDERDPVMSNNAATVETLVEAIADLSVTLAAAPDPTVIAGTSLVYTIAVHNAGPSGAVDVTITDLLPPELHVTGGDCTSGTPVTCVIETLPVGNAATRTIEVEVDQFARGSIADTVEVSSAEDDPDDGNNADTVETLVEAVSDLILTLLAAPNPVVAGTNLSYSVKVTNQGPSGATAIAVSQTLPAGVSWLSGCEEAGGMATCEWDQLAREASATFTVLVHVDPFRREPLTSTATSHGAANEIDPHLATNSHTQETAVIAKTDLRITMTDRPDPAVAGTFLRYEIDIANEGPSGATGVQVIDTLPPGVLFVPGSSSAGCSRTEGVVTCVPAALGPGEEASFALAVVPSVAARLVNTAEVLGDEDDPDTSNNEVAVSTQVSGPAGGSAGAGDFDGDGHLDLAVADENTDLVKIFRNDGHGVFTQIQQVPVGHKPTALAIGDLDDDGQVDIAVANWGDDDVSLLRNDGMGHFVEATRPGTTGMRPIAIAAGDFDGDGWLDLAVAHELSDNVSILKHTVSGAWMEHSIVAVGATNSARHPSAIAAGDLDGDGRLDLVVTNNVAGSLSLLVNLGEGEFALQEELPFSFADHPVAVAVGDYDADGDLDLAVVGSVHDTVTILRNHAGAFAEDAGGIAVGHTPAGVATGDFSGDGRLDLAVANTNDDTVSALANGGGTFPASLASTMAAGQKPIAVISGDVNGDETLDLVVVNAHAIVTVLLNQMP